VAYRWYVDEHHNGVEDTYNRAKLELMAHLPCPIESTIRKHKANKNIEHYILPDHLQEQLGDTPPSIGTTDDHSLPE
jgi:hypothetical protein